MVQSEGDPFNAPAKGRRGDPAYNRGVQADSHPALAAALEEADHLGWLLYADKQALAEGKLAEVAARVAARARGWRLRLLGTPGLMLVPVMLGTFDRRHGLLGPIAGYALLAMFLAYSLLVLPRLWRTVSRVEREVSSAARLSTAPLR
jgi:hypothetical protein